MPNIMAFKTLDESGFLEFGVSNAKYLTFDTLDGNALMLMLLVSETCATSLAPFLSRDETFK